MTRTSISVDKTTKQRLDDLRPDDVSWNDFADELADAYEGGDVDVDVDVEAIEVRLARVEEQVDKLPGRVVDDLERNFR